MGRSDRSQHKKKDATTEEEVYDLRKSVEDMHHELGDQLADLNCSLHALMARIVLANGSDCDPECLKIVNTVTRFANEDSELQKVIRYKDAGHKHKTPPVEDTASKGKGSSEGTGSTEGRGSST